jgi:small-conductance mechanosensitive channel
MPNAPRLFYGNTLGDWIAAGIIAFTVWTVLSIVRRVLAARYQHWSQAARHSLALRLLFYLLGNTQQFLVLALALRAGEDILTFPPRVQHGVSGALVILVLLQVGLWGVRAVRFYVEVKTLERGPDQLFAGSLEIIHFVAGLIIWSLVSLVALENLGVNITALLAGLGVGGVAVALALQNVLGDLFASLSIALDKPFVIGDFLTIDAFSGTVERIGIKSTRLRSESGEQIILSNADLLKSRVRNYGRAPEQRALSTIRVDYATPGETLRGIPRLLEQIVREHANARFERCHLKALADSYLQFELSYFVLQPKLNPLLDLQQAVNFRIIEEFRRRGIAFAYPLKRVLVEQAGAGA